MKRQARSYWCGVASVANALEVLGIRRAQREVNRLCYVSPAAGCDEVEMKRALLANGVGVDEWHDADLNQSALWLRHCIANGMPTILCVDNDEHWVTVLGMCGESFIVFDPARNTGVEVHDLVSLGARWINGDGVYYGIGVSKLSTGG